MGGLLRVVAGPVGNLEDISDRAKRALAEADLVVVEDSRVTGKLLSALSLKKRMVVLNEHTSPGRFGEVLREVLGSETSCLLTDAGTPCVSDPGSELVDAVWEAGGRVEPVPGPSAVMAAISASGFFAQRFVFLGFVPRKAGDLRQLFEPYSEATTTLVYFDSPHRFVSTLTILGQVLPGRRYAVCRELTKVHEQVTRGLLPDLPEADLIPAKGEFTIVIEGSRRGRSSR